jgi:thioredoxin
MTIQTTIRTAMILTAFACGAASAQLPATSPALPVAAAEVPAQTEDSSASVLNAIVKSPIPVLVDFWAPWCRPCLMLKPVLEDIEKKYATKITMVRLNVDVYQRMAQMFQISGIPAIFLVDKGKIVDNLVGYLPAERYEEAIDKVLAARELEQKKTPAVPVDTVQTTEKQVPQPATVPAVGTK